MTRRQQRGAAEVALDVVGEDRVEDFVRRQSVLVHLPGCELGGRWLVDDLLRDRFDLTALAGGCVAPARELPHKCLGDVLDRREAAGGVAVERGEAGRELALVAADEHEVAELVGQRHPCRPADA